MTKELRQGLASALLLLSMSATAFALNPSFDVSQYGHNSWKVRDGFVKGEILSIAQALDGYLWLGTEFGLVRFDGVRTTSWEPPNDQRLPSNRVTKLLSAHDGSLWIGTSKGLARLSGGKLTAFGELAGLTVYALLEDRDGSIWVGSYGVPDGKLCNIRASRTQCYPEVAEFGREPIALNQDAGGNLWVGLRTGVVRWAPGPPDFYPVPGQPFGIRSIANVADGGILIGTVGGVSRLINGKFEPAYAFSAADHELRTRALLRDRDGALWLGTSAEGLVHVHQDRADTFSRSDGLAGDFITDLLEDREGNIWVAAAGGIDRFREVPVVTYSAKQGIPDLPNGVVLGSRDGSIWFGAGNGLNRLPVGRASVGQTSVGQAPNPTQTPLGSREAAQVIDIPGLSDHLLASLFEDSQSRIWISSQSRVGYLENGRRYVSTAVPGGSIQGLAEDSSGKVWIANQSLGLFEWSSPNHVEQVPWTTFGRKDAASFLLADSRNGGLWLGFFNGGIAWFKDRQLVASYSAKDGLGPGRVNQLRFDARGVLWAATENGLSRIQDGRITTVTSKDGLPCDVVKWTAEDDRGAVWLMLPCGLVRVRRAELENWVAVPDKPRRTISTTLFDAYDGVRLTSAIANFSPSVAKSPDGRLWFYGADGISAVDPNHIPFNSVPPLVQIEAAKVNGKAELAPLAGLALSHSSNDLEIDYSALSLRNPERVRFRYKLEGHDTDWQDVGTRRQAFYGGLPPKSYRFRVVACNDDGVWNATGAVWAFRIAPAIYQRIWFQALAVLAAGAMLWLLYRMRLHQMTARLNLRMQERLDERTRIAQELHDTLLQGFISASMQLSVANRQLPNDWAAKPLIQDTLELIKRVIQEGRDAVKGMRIATPQQETLEQALSGVPRELGIEVTARIRTIVEGQPRPLHPLVRDETYRISREALVNSLRHSRATEIEIEVEYSRHLVRVLVRDDGIGIDPVILANGRDGHWGLSGMRERAEKLGGKLALKSLPGRGTEVDLSIPSDIATPRSSSPVDFQRLYRFLAWRKS